MTGTQLQSHARATTERATTRWRLGLWLVLVLAAFALGCSSDDSDLDASADAAIGTGSVSTRPGSADSSTKLSAQGDACAADFAQCRTSYPNEFLSRCLPLAERCGLFTVLDGVQCAVDYAVCVAATPLDWTGCIQQAEQCGLLLNGTGACVGEFRACVQTDPTKAIKCLEVATDCGLFATGALP